MLTHLLSARKTWSPLVVLALAVVALGLSGCVSRQFLQDPEVRARSFAPHANRYVGFTEVRDYLAPRVALLVGGDEPPRQEWRNGTMSIQGYMSCAAAIDRRGYFLTAEHCVDEGATYLIRAEPGAPPRARRARIVWQGNRKAGGPDLAIIHIPETLGYVFEWADEIAENDPVMAVGLNRTPKVLKGPAWLGGKILKLGRSDGDEGNPTVLNDVPLQRGDSGGPLLNEKARLIGINVEGRVGLFRSLLPNARAREGLAERPDRKWVEELIEKDAANPPPVVSEEVFVFGAGHAG
jgi:S1-C subfamily serine protease